MGIDELAFTYKVPSWLFAIIKIVPLLITGAWFCYVWIERKHFMFCWKKHKLSHYLPGPTRAAREQDFELNDSTITNSVCPECHGIGKTSGN